MTRRVLINSFMAVFISVVQLYTIATWPIYFVLQKPWKRRAKSERPLVEMYVPERVLRETSPEEDAEEKLMSPIYRRLDKTRSAHELFSYDTITGMFNRLPKFYDPETKIIGYRQVLSEVDSLDEHGNLKRIDGRQLKQYRLSDYQWLTYGQVDSVTNNLAQGLMSMGITDSDKVLILSETRVEWMLSAQAIIRTGAAVVTLFSNLGLDGIAHGIIETEANTVICSMDGLPLLKQVLSREGHKVKRIVYIDSFKKPVLDGFDTSMEILSLSELEECGKKVIQAGDSKEHFVPTPDSLMIIMYTSGTTGTPKAALMTHRQFVASLKALFILVEDLIDQAPEHCYISYLPMAHVLELTVEFFFFVGGVKIGYASPFTLTDSAPGLAKGEKSDIKLLRPTVITAVPLVLDRILKEVHEKLRARTPVSEHVFKFLMNYKSRWTKMGYKCNIVKNILCSKVRDQLGGNLSYMIVGGAPLDSRTQSTIKSALDVTLIQGYGATETTGACLCMDLQDLEYGCVGAPLGGDLMVRLKDWPEGGYYNSDKPRPRGEILIGGDVIVNGYYKLPRQSEEVFFTDKYGIRWFRTGDIGEMSSNGKIKIIDRRKDLIKLQNGEYISLGKVEAALKGCRYVDNVCVYGGTFSSDLVALVSPNQKSLDELTAQYNKQLLTWEEKCDDDEIEQMVFVEIVKCAKGANLSKKEIPLRIRLVSEEWTPDNGILTAALKLKRRMIETMYKKQLYELYNEKKIKVVTSKHYDQNNNLNSNGTTIKSEVI